METYLRCVWIYMCTHARVSVITWIGLDKIHFIKIFRNVKFLKTSICNKKTVTVL